MQIGEKIKNYRKTAGLTQEQVADYLDVSTPAINKWEKGNTYPDISLLPAIARLLKIDMNTFKDFENACKGATVHAGLNVRFNEDEQITSDDEIQKWVKQIAK